MPFDLDVKVFVESLGPEAAKMLAQAGADTKVEVETEQTSRRGITPLTSLAVDGREVDDFSTVKAESVIFEYWDYRCEMIKACFEECQARSPILTGEYRDHFYVMADDVPFPYLSVPTAFEIKDATRLLITNDRAYSRRLEVGVTEGGSSFAKTVDPHIIQSASKAVAQEFAGLAKFGFTFVQLENGYQPKQSWLNHRARKSGGAKQKTPQPMRYPAITIEQV